MISFMVNDFIIKIIIDFTISYLINFKVNLTPKVSLGYNLKFSNLKLISLDMYFNRN
jgi:hypothetical protein